MSCFCCWNWIVSLRSKSSQLIKIRLLTHISLAGARSFWVRIPRLDSLPPCPLEDRAHHKILPTLACICPVTRGSSSLVWLWKLMADDACRQFSRCSSAIHVRNCHYCPHLQSTGNKSNHSPTQPFSRTACQSQILHPKRARVAEAIAATVFVW